MKRLLIVLAAAVAGFGLGTLAGGKRGDVFEKGNAATTRPGEEARELKGAADPREVAVGTALAELRSPHVDLAGLARLGEALSQLDSAQVARVLDQLERTGWRMHDDRLAWLFTWWQKRDPVAAQAWVRPRLDLIAQDGPAGFTFEMNPRGKLVLAWAKADPQAALDYARQHARSGLATALLREVMAAWKDRDIGERLALVREFPEGTARTKILNELHRQWGEKQPAAALASANALPPGYERDRTISQLLTSWADRDAAAAFAQYRALGLNDPVTLSEVLGKSARKNVPQTLEWIGQLDAAQAARCGPWVVEAWAEKDPAAALDWALANGVSVSWQNVVHEHVEHNGLGRSSSSGGGWQANPLASALRNKPEATLGWLRGLPVGPERDRMTELAVTMSADRKNALALFPSLPPDAVARAAGKIARLFQDDVEAGYVWAISLPAGPARTHALKGIGGITDKIFDLPPGPERDAMLSGGIHRFGNVPPPAERLTPLLEISDPVLRRDTIDEMMSDYTSMSYFEEDARAALEKANVPDEWKQRWRPVPARRK